MFALIAAEVLLILLTAPVRVKVRVHADVFSARFAAKAEVAGAEVLTATFRDEKEGFTLRINGEKRSFCKTRAKFPSRAALRAALAEARDARVFAGGRVSVAAGCGECAEGALFAGGAAAVLSALPPVVGRKTFFLPHAALVVEAEAVLALSVLSVLRIAAAYRGGERGKKTEEKR